ncbi:HAD family hydrolase [Geodermatophilus sp. TF02-6]|nr:HAD family hydrolase [Geodermatophilus sp. TF02-6]
MVELPCRALLVDVDGVLVDSDASVALSWSRWARERDLDPAEVLGTVHGRRTADTVALLVGPDERARALAAVDRYELEDVGSTTALPGAAELLGQLPAGAWAVVTSGRRELATARLAVAGLPVPAVSVCGEDVPAGKPDPAGYRRAAAELGLPPGDCVVLEDSPPGVAAGTAAGATVVGVSERALASGARLVVRDLRGLTWTGSGLGVDSGALLRS